jgi:hypothetical protein
VVLGEVEIVATILKQPQHQTRLKSLLSSSNSLPLFLFLKIHLLCHDVEGIVGMQMMMTLATNAAEARHSAGF